MRLIPLVVLLLVSFTYAPAAHACLWDYDTLKEERSRFPSTYELVTEQFSRHSYEFYRWRVEDREARLAGNPDDMKLRDDLAVAYEKTGQTGRAINLMRDSLRTDDERYETHANLGTFLIHAGQYEEGVQHLDRALAINPDAHFGRERYQRWLAEYVMLRLDEKGKPRLPLSAASGDVRTQPIPPQDFAQFIASKLENKHRLSLEPEQTRPAVEGVLGMMRFGNADSPILLEALGDLLRHEANADGDAKQLAAMAYLRAASRVDDEAAKQRYRELAAGALRMQQRRSWRGSKDVTLAEIEAQVAEGLAAGKKLQARIAADERRWIAAGEDVEAKYDAKYRDAAEKR